MPLLLLKYWKPLAGFLLLFCLIGGFYYKGRVDATRAIEHRTQAEFERKLQAYIDEQSRSSQKQEEIKIYRQTHTQSDKVDSCLLSNNPISPSVKCTN